jgi:long-chain acyl-CoA synthetase
MVRGPIVMQGYFGNAKATRETIEPDGWLHTGDVAHMDADGYIYVVDRKKEMIITAGYNVYPAEVERVISQHPAIAMVAVGNQPDELKGEVAKAYVVLRHGARADEAENIWQHTRSPGRCSLWTICPGPARGRLCDGCSEHLTHKDHQRLACSLR